MDEFYWVKITGSETWTVGRKNDGPFWSVIGYPVELPESDLEVGERIVNRSAVTA